MIWPFRSKRRDATERSGAPVERTVDDRTFMLGLDRLYREAMKRHERAELREAAGRLLAVLAVAPSSGPVEGYYVENAELTTYFRAMRALQDVDADRIPDVKGNTDYERLVQLTSSPMYGRAKWADKILPRGRDPLTVALLEPEEPELGRLVTRAAAIADELDDISLVGMGARLRDAVLLTALRESVVLYAEVGFRGLPVRNEFVWKVSDSVSTLARRFIAEYERLFPGDAGSALPPPVAGSAEAYWSAAERNDVIGRCVYVAYDPRRTAPYYHLAVRWGKDGPDVEAFWAREIWTTAAYGKRLELAVAGLELPPFA